VILLLGPGGTAVLEQPDDFGRFHLEIDPAWTSVEAAQAALLPLGHVESRELAWIDRDALFDLGRRTAADTQAWAANAQAMLDKAARYGWVRDESPAIKSHIIWRA